MSKKHITLFVVSTVFFVLIMCGSIWGILHNKITQLEHSLTSNIGTQIHDIKTSDFVGLQSYLVKIIDTAKKSVVSITISKDIKFYVDDPSLINGPGNIHQQIAKVGGGSGIIISKQGYILTNKHVVQDTQAKYSVTLYNGKTYNVDKIRFDDILDLAVLKITNSETGIIDDLFPASFLPLTTPVDVGQFVLVIGNSLTNYPNSVTMGLISAKNRQLIINNNNLYIGLYQTDALINHGNSGGPFFDIHGNVIGITTAITEGQGIGFALPLSKEFVDALIKSIDTYGSIVRPVLGIQYIDITTSLQKEKKLTSQSGIYIKDVITDLPAAQAGLKIGDIVIGINTIPIDTTLPFLYQLYTYVPGDHIVLDVIRNATTIKIPIILGGITQ